MEIDLSGQNFFGVSNYVLNQDLNLIAKEFNADYLVEAIGNIEFDFYMKNPFFYSRAEFENREPIFRWTEIDTNLLQYFMFCLWFVKDNSSNILLLTAVSDDNYILTNRKETSVSNSAGDHTLTKFTYKELEEAYEFLLIIDKISSVKSIEDALQVKKRGLILNPDYHSEKYNARNRIERALLFLQIARSQSFLPPKISFYVLAIECLFSANDLGEIQHKIAERVAMYIGRSSTEKQIIFEKIKNGYKIRSKYLHGQTLSKSQDKLDVLIEISNELDDLVRQILKKVLREDSAKFLLKEEELTLWFNSLLFG
ncbi:HEPN domain-containing protein [Larkinella soli]|uniref:HEPN domain-containing protein n=1 Tax=Larkinella soli TaxID=1770527 RepID=UPI000FFC0634|nr:HEPN domain-containing protein [Larkinella soli]